MTRPRRRAGLRWRLLVHDAPTVGGDGMNGVAHHIMSSASGAARRLRKLQAARATDNHLETRQVLPDTEFDELVADDWLHVEQQDVNTWWMTVGGVTLWVTANRDGKPRRVSVTMPGGYDNPFPGCVYSLDGEPWEVGGVEEAQSKGRVVPLSEVSGIYSDLFPDLTNVDDIIDDVRGDS